MIWTTLGVLLGGDVTVMKKPLGNIPMNTPSWACIGPKPFEVAQYIHSTCQ